MLAFLSTTSTLHLQTGSLYTYLHMFIYLCLNGLLPQIAVLIPSAIIFYWYSFIHDDVMNDKPYLPELQMEAFRRQGGSNERCY